MNEPKSTPATESEKQASRRELLSTMKKAAYIAPATIALLSSTRAAASP